MFKELSPSLKALFIFFLLQSAFCWGSVIGAAAFFHAKAIEINPRICFAVYTLVAACFTHCLLRYSLITDGTDIVGATIFGCLVQILLNPGFIGWPGAILVGEMYFILLACYMSHRERN